MLGCGRRKIKRSESTELSTEFFKTRWCSALQENDVRNGIGKNSDEIVRGVEHQKEGVLLKGGGALIQQGL